MANPAMVTVMILKTIFRIRDASNEGQPETFFGISGRAQPTSDIPRMQPANGFPAPRGSLIFSSVSASPDVRCEAKKKAVTVANQGGQVLWAFPVIRWRNQALPAKPCQFDRQRAPFP